MLKKDWQEAIELILKPRGNESPQMTRMKAHWWMFRNPWDAVVLIDRISRSKSIEAALLQGRNRRVRRYLLTYFIKVYNKYLSCKQDDHV